MKIKEINAKVINDSRKDKTISITINTNIGKFSASAPNGKSKGKSEAKPYKKSLEEDVKEIKKIGEYFTEEVLEKFDDLRRVEDLVECHVGANTAFALESAILKGIAKEQKKQIWEIINPKAKKIPRFVGNCIGGGKHSETETAKKPDFQEFLLIPNLKSAKKNYEKLKENKKQAKSLLEQKDKKFKGLKNDEDAWITSLNEKEVFDVLKETGTPLGTDIAASGFYKRKKYLYKNPRIDRTPNEQVDYLSNLIKNFNIFYVEDPFYEEDFESFAKLLKKHPQSLIVGDDLTVTNPKRLKKAVDNNSINSLIVKPNQIGSLMQVKRVCEIAKENNLKTIFSHRSGETNESILADLAFGFEADFMKCGITGKEREVKIKRLIEIEKSLE